AEDGIRDLIVTGVQTCALPICLSPRSVGEVCGEPGESGGTEDGGNRKRGEVRCVAARLLTAQTRGERDGEANAVMMVAVVDCRRSEERRVGKEWVWGWWAVWGM